VLKCNPPSSRFGSLCYHSGIKLLFLRYSVVNSFFIFTEDSGGDFKIAEIILQIAEMILQIVGIILQIGGMILSIAEIIL